MCYFVFKPKTACDVRISDWSSDVCSSDLLRLDGRAEPVHLLLALVSGGVHSGEAGNATSAKLEKLSTQWMDSMLRKDKVRLEELMAPEFVLHTAHPTYPETPREMWLDNLFNHLVIDPWQQTDIFSGNRSEEHTSELQSLMRISYAVFCLKKKKTINNQSQTVLNIKDVAI